VNAEADGISNEIMEADFEGSTKSDEIPIKILKKNLLKTTLLSQCKEMC
jgi:hypothetical protein